MWLSIICLALSKLTVGTNHLGRACSHTSVWPRNGMPCNLANCSIQSPSVKSNLLGVGRSASHFSSFPGTTIPDCSVTKLAYFASVANVFLSTIDPKRIPREDASSRNDVNVWEGFAAGTNCDANTKLGTEAAVPHVVRASFNRSRRVILLTPDRKSTRLNSSH